MIPHLHHETWWGDLIAMGLSFLAGYMFCAARSRRSSTHEFKHDASVSTDVRYDSEGRRIPDPPTPQGAQVILREGPRPKEWGPESENDRADRC
jgi:hypothetical protein